MFVASEGWCCRYEVLALRDGYLVQMRDVATGDLEREFSTLFRTLPVAVAYAVMSAAYERFVEMDEEEEDFPEIEAELYVSEQNFMDLSDRLGDCGIQQEKTASVLH
jgi:hypothetical protein